MKQFYERKLAYALFLLLLLTGLNATMNAQTFNQNGTGVLDHTGYPGNPNNYYQVYENYGDTMRFNITNLAPNPISNIVLRVYFEGDFGSNTIEYLNVYSETGYLGIAQLPYSGFDCDPEDSTDFIIPLATFQSWIADDTIKINIGATFDVDLFCTNNWSKVKIIYDYCPFGTPTYASINLTDSVFCPDDAAIVLTGTPAGGVFSGPGVTGNTFDPTGLPAGSYEVSYTATDIGCTTTDYATLQINNYPFISNVQICPGDTAVFSSIPGAVIFATDQSFTNILDTAMLSFSYGPLFGTTTLYTLGIDADEIFQVTSLTSTDSIVVDHNSFNGDDRGGIAVTDSFVFINGDNSIVRYNLDMTNPVTYPRTDGLVSDLRSGKMYVLWDNVNNAEISYNFANFNLELTSLRRIDNNFNYTSEYVTLSTPITIGYAGGYSGVFAGYGYIGLFNNVDSHYYVIDTDNGDVQDLGIGSFNPYSSENWANWGVLEYDGSNYTILYRSNTYFNSITRKAIPSGTDMDAYQFPNGLSDLATFTYHPQTDRWYLHYESGTTTFGGSNETGVAANGSDTIVSLPMGNTSCGASVTAFITDINLGNDTTICETNAPLVIEAGIGYSSYTWNGVNNNWNVYPVMQSGAYIVEAEDNIGCTIVDTINVTVNPCLGIEDLDNSMLVVYPNPSNGNFNVQLDLNGIALIEVVDMHGRQVFSRKVELTSGITTIPVELVNAMDGVYLVKVSMGEFVKTARVIVKK